MFFKSMFSSKTKFYEQYIICTQGIINTVRASLPLSPSLLVMPLKSTRTRLLWVSGGVLCAYTMLNTFLFLCIFTIVVTQCKMLLWRF